jgi:hypothetical protein
MPIHPIDPLVAAFDVLDLPRNASRDRVCKALMCLTEDYAPGAPHGDMELFKLVIAASSFALANINTDRCCIPHTGAEYMQCATCGPATHFFITASIYHLYYQCTKCGTIATSNLEGGGRRNRIIECRYAWVTFLQDDLPAGLQVV